MVTSQSIIDSGGFKGGTRGAPIMPRDTVSRTANVGTVGTNGNIPDHGDRFIRVITLALFWLWDKLQITRLDRNTFICLAFPSYRHADPHPLPSQKWPHMHEGAQCAETNEKSIFRFLVFDLWSSLCSKFIENWQIFSTKSTISRKLNIAELSQVYIKPF